MTRLRILWHALHGVILALGDAIEAHAKLTSAKADAWADDVWHRGYCAGFDDAVAFIGGDSS